MSKAVLVMDMPSSCNECILRNAGACFPVSKQTSICGVYYTMKEGRKPDWCPLKPMPEKANHPDWCDGGRYDKGYNACIDELLKGEEG